jgi:hypothetical protein
MLVNDGQSYFSRILMEKVTELTKDGLYLLPKPKPSIY